MQKSLEFTGKNEDAAIAAALEKLGLSREDVSVEVLELAKPGFLGIGGTPAKVKVTFEAPDEPEEIPAPVAEEKPAAPAAEKKAAPAVEEKDEESAPVRTSGNYTAAPAGDEKAQRIVEFLTGLLEHMEVEAVPQVSLDEEGNYLVELEGKGLGQVIGHRGETLDAIQQLTGYAVNKGESKRCRIRIDAEGYRAKREESLEKMANRVAYYGSIFGALTAAFLFLAHLLPDYPGADNGAFEASYSMVGRIFLASLSAFLASQLTNNFIFEKIRNSTKEHQLIRRIFLSSCVAHLVDSLVFETVAFYGRLPFMEFVTQAAFAYAAGLLLEAMLLPLTKYLANSLVDHLQYRHGKNI